MSLKENILQLRSEGKTYLQIMNELQCAKSTIAYYCGHNQKEKNKLRKRKNRQKQHPYCRKLENFILIITKNTQQTQNTLQNRRLIQIKIQSFHYTHKEYGMYKPTTFSIQDIINKFGENPICYLTGEQIDIYQPRTYEFDHIIPRSRGGTNTLDNLGICSKKANRSKKDMTPDEFINLCKKILEHNGYQVVK
jgi:5-methylcytosine-specific restriction endonuclease McrA